LNVAKRKKEIVTVMAMTNPSTRARLFVEKFLQDQGAEAADLFKCDLENAIEELLTEVVAETKDAAEASQRPLVWLKPKPAESAVVVHTLRSWDDELVAGRASAKA
jgi:hypothetical protein